MVLVVVASCLCDFYFNLQDMKDDDWKRNGRDMMNFYPNALFMNLLRQRFIRHCCDLIIWYDGSELEEYLVVTMNQFVCKYEMESLLTACLSHPTTTVMAKDVVWYAVYFGHENAASFLVSCFCWFELERIKIDWMTLREWAVVMKRKRIVEQIDHQIDSRHCGNLTYSSSYWFSNYTLK